MTTPKNQPTPPPGMEILKDYTKPLPEGTLYEIENGTWVPSRWVGCIPLRECIYAIPITPTVPATGDTTNEKGGDQRQELPIPEASYSCGGSCREDRSLPADDLAWFPKVKLWLCSECSEDTEEVGDAEITLEDYLKTRK